MSNPHQVILVVGGGLGIGLCVTRGILQISQNAHIVVFGLHADPELDNLSTENAGRVTTVIGDVTKAADRINALEACKKDGGVDTLVYCAGTMGAINRIENLDIKAFKSVYDVNLFGIIAMVQLCLPSLRTSALRYPTNVACGKIIALSSACGSRVTYQGWAAYCSSKAAVSRLVGVIAHEERSLSIQGVYPRLTRTRMPEDVIAGRYTSVMADHECERFREWSDRGDEIVEPPEWCGVAVAKLALGKAGGGRSGEVLYYDEHVPNSRPKL